MPYIFLNTVAETTNVYAPTPIILFGDKLNEENIVKEKFANVISDKTGCPAYLLCVPLAELLRILENECYKTVKINRSGNHNIWVLHKDRNLDKKFRINSIKHQTVPVSKENHALEGNSSSSSMEPFENTNLECFFGPATKSEKCQTLATVSLLGGGDFTDIFSVQCQTSPSVVDATNNTVDNKRHQNPMNSVEVLNSTNFGCQYDENVDSVLPEKCSKYVTLKSNNCKYDVNQFLSGTTDDTNDIFDNISEKDKSDVKKESTQDGYIKVPKRVNSETDTITLTNTSNIDPKNSSLQNNYNKFDNCISFESQYENLFQRSSSNDKLNNKAQDILTKLEKRFQNEHDYFSNVRIKKIKNKEETIKKSTYKNKNVGNNRTISLVNLKHDDAMKYREENEIQLNSSQVERCKKTKRKGPSVSGQVRPFEFNNNFKINPSRAYKSMKEKSSESVAFYEATDSVSGLSKKGSQNNISADADEFIDNIERSRKSDYYCVEKLRNIKFREKTKKMSSKKTNDVDCDENINKTEYFNRIMTFDSLENIKHVDCFDKAGKLDSAKSRITIEYNHFDNKITPPSDSLTQIKKQEEIKNKLQVFANKQRVDFRTRFIQRIGKSPFPQKRTRNPAVPVPSSAPERSRSQPSKESGKNLENFIDLKVKKTVKTPFYLKKERNRYTP